MLRGCASDALPLRRRGGFDELDPIWWHSNGDGDPLAHPPEPEGAHEQRLVAQLVERCLPSFPHLCCADVFLERVSRFRAWLAARPERVIAVVSHWGVLDALTQLEFANCEVRPSRSPRPARRMAWRHACAAMRMLCRRASRPDATPPGALPAALLSAATAARARAAGAGAAGLSRHAQRLMRFVFTIAAG